MNWINYRTMLSDLELFQRTLPVVDGVIGIPRSGMLLASYVALRRNIPLLDLSLFQEDIALARQQSSLRKSNPAVRKRIKPSTGKYLLIDDCCGETCTTMQTTLADCGRNTAEYQLIPAALYVENAVTASRMGIRYHLEYAKPRLFEWNFFRHKLMEESIWDIDGALCEEWKYKEAYEPIKYLDHLENASPLYIPERTVLAVCTNRLFQRRTSTVAWLKAQQVNYKNLIMSECRSIEERNTKDNPAGIAKGEYYQRSEAKLFVESSAKQAKVICEVAKKPVLCIDNMQLYA